MFYRVGVAYNSKHAKDRVGGGGSSLKDVTEIFTLFLIRLNQ